MVAVVVRWFVVAGKWLVGWREEVNAYVRRLPAAKEAAALAKMSEEFVVLIDMIVVAIDWLEVSRLHGHNN